MPGRDRLSRHDDAGARRVRHVVGGVRSVAPRVDRVANGAEVADLQHCAPAREEHPAESRIRSPDAELDLRGAPEGRFPVEEPQCGLGGEESESESDADTRGRRARPRPFDEPDGCGSEQHAAETRDRKRRAHREVQRGRGREPEAGHDGVPLEPRAIEAPSPHEQRGAASGENERHGGGKGAAHDGSLDPLAARVRGVVQERNG